MHDLVTLVGNYGDQWRMMPVIARAASTTYVLCDHRNPPSERSKVIAPLVRRLGVGLDVHVVGPPLGVCEEGYHLWEGVEHNGAMVAAVCEHCGTVEQVDPVPVPKVARHLRAVS